MSLSTRALVVALLCAVSPSVSANVGQRDRAGFSMVDSKPGGAVVIPRYATPPAFTGTGDGTMNYPVLPAVLWDFSTKTVKVPVETWTIIATTPLTFSVTGSVSGAQAAATVNVDYQTSSGIDFTINAGGTPFAIGDQFTFSIVDKLDAATLPGATSYTLTDDGYRVAPAPGFNISGYSTAQVDYAMIIRDDGYLSITNNTNPPSSLLKNFNVTLPGNQALPSRDLSMSGQIEDVMPLWDDLLPKSTSKIWVATVGRSGSRNFVVEWVDFAHKDDPTASYTFEVVFFENARRIRFQYLNMADGTKTSANGSTATVGIQNTLTTLYAYNQYSMNSASLMNGLSIEFGIDTDGDRLPDGIEAQYGTLPNNKFTDGGSPAISDGAQLAAGLDPTSAADNASKSTDTDGDNLVDVEETYWGLNPNARDSDGDGIQDDIELSGGRTNPLIADTDGDGIKDGDEDTNKNGVVDSGELDPTLWDSDGDGVSDGDERTETTDPLLATSRRLSAAVTLGDGTAYTTPSAVGSKGYLHLAWYQRNNNNDNTANDLYVALLGPDSTAGAEPYKVLVAATQITAHTGFDDRPPAIVTLPGSGAIDRTLILNHAKNGEAFLTEIDFNQAARDGTASLSSTLVAHTRQITLPLAMQHVAMKAASDGSLQVVFLGSPPSSANQNGEGLSHRKVNRGVYYLKLSAAGDVLVAPTELYVKSPPAHGHIFPRIDLDKSGDVHGIFRAGSCNWTMGTAGCSIYYFKISGAGQVLVPATRLQLDGNGGIDKAPQLAVAPNGDIDIVYASIAPRLVNNSGGNVVGRPILLHVISSVNNQITTLVNQKVLVDASPPPPVALDPSARLAVYHVPVVALDAGGNLHLFATEYGSNGSHNGYYWVFDPSGAKKLGPFAVASANSYGIPAVNVSQNRAFFSYHDGSNYTTTRSFDFSGLGLDESGNAQVPPPTVGKLTLTSVTPNVGPIGGKLLVTLVGSQFLSTTVPTIGGVTLTGVLLYDPAHLVGTLDTTPLQPGAYDATVTNPNGDTATLAGAFYVGTPPDLATVNDGSMNPPAADMGTTKMSSGGCSCDVSGREANLPLLSLLAFALLAFALRRRARR